MKKRRRKREKKNEEVEDAQKGKGWVHVTDPRDRINNLVPDADQKTRNEHNTMPLGLRLLSSTSRPQATS